MKNIQSIEGSFAFQSYISPLKNNKPTQNFSTRQSMQFSDFQLTNSLLPINSVQRIKKNYQVPTLLFQIQQFTNELKESSTQKRFNQLLCLQKWVQQTYGMFRNNNILIKQNQQKISKIIHQNILKKDAAMHAKKMGEYFQNKYNKYQIKIQNRYNQQVKWIKEIIYDAKQRTQILIEQIKESQQQINKQKARSKQLLNEIKNKLRNKKSNQLPRRLSERKIQYGYAPYQYSSHKYFDYQLVPSYNLAPHYLKNSGKIPSESDINKNTNKTVRQSHNKQSRTSSTLNCRSQRGSFDSRNTTHLEYQISNIERLNSKISQSSKLYHSKSLDKLKQNKLSKFMQSSGKQVNKYTKCKITQKSDEDQTIVYSPTNAVKVFSLQPSLNLSKLLDLGKKSKLNQTKVVDNDNIQSKIKISKKFANNNIQQSLVVVEIEDSMLMSKNNLFQRKGKQIQNNNSSQSLIKVQTESNESKQGQLSNIQDQKHNKILNKNETKLKSPKLQIKQQNFNNNALPVKKANNPLCPPPKLKVQKKSSKYIGEQPDLLLGSKSVPTQQKEAINNNIQNFQLKDLSTHKSSLIISQTFSEFVMQTQIKTEEPLQKQKLKKVTQQQQDDDIMNINLLAVSRISKQKTLSQKMSNYFLDNKSLTFQQNTYKGQNLIIKNTIPHSQIIQEQQFFKGQEQIALHSAIFDYDKYKKLS